MNSGYPGQDSNPRSSECDSNMFLLPHFAWFLIQRRTTEAGRFLHDVRAYLRHRDRLSVLCHYLERTLPPPSVCVCVAPSSSATRPASRQTRLTGIVTTAERVFEKAMTTYIQTAGREIESKFLPICARYNRPLDRSVRRPYITRKCVLALARVRVCVCVCVLVRPLGAGDVFTRSAADAYTLACRQVAATDSNNNIKERSRPEAKRIIKGNTSCRSSHDPVVDFTDEESTSAICSSKRNKSPGTSRIRLGEVILLGEPFLFGAELQLSTYNTVASRKTSARARTLLWTQENCCLLASQQSEQGSNPGVATPGILQVGIVPDDVVGRWVSSGISHFPHPFIPALLHAHLASPSSALNTLTIRAA
ncbi:hypothetical protein PR048_005140 [Dryococelus australis]|uniref:Uncharacterized protein n=1 Tax=Dryococelus australis TaxID=614101 RepID=A0ABQ9I7D3_9NEOP|nr:hypothetical protein PR048_005140 [Dryococelus australis]